MAPQRALLSLIACLFVYVSQSTAWSAELKVFHIPGYLDGARRNRPRI
jgi:hypothetical protein